MNRLASLGAGGVLLIAAATGGYLIGDSGPSSGGEPADTTTRVSRGRSR